MTDPEQQILGRNGHIQATDSLLTAMVRRLEAATSRLEDIASSAFPSGADAGAVGASNGSQSPGPGAKLASAGAPAAPKPAVESLPPAIAAYDELVNKELKTWTELSSLLGEVIEGQSKAVQQAFAAQRQFIFIANKAKKPDDRTIMELLKDLQASMEKTDEFRQTNREAALKDPLSMVADGVGCLGWITISSSGSMKPHEHIKELFGGAQMYGNKVLKEYRDKYAQPLTRVAIKLILAGLRTKPLWIGCEPTINYSKHRQNTQRSIIQVVLHGTPMASMPKKLPSR